MKYDLPEITNQIDIKNYFVNATPDGKYAIRILKAFRERCNEKWILEGDIHGKPLFEQMNKDQDLRAEELDKAIVILKREL